jgi:hypothetical protein
MNERTDKRLPVGLIWLLIYHWIIVLICLGYLVAAVVILITDRDYVAVLGAVLSILVLTCWTTAMVYASVGMVRKMRRGLLVGMICHLLLAILSSVGVATFVVLGIFEKELTPLFSTLCPDVVAVCCVFELGFPSWGMNNPS